MTLQTINAALLPTYGNNVTPVVKERNYVPTASGFLRIVDTYSAIQVHNVFPALAASHMDFISSLIAGAGYTASYDTTEDIITIN